MAHLGGIVSRGPGLVFVEATSITPEGRITPEDSGLWKQSQAEALKKIVDFAHSQNKLIAIQLGHAGRKASTVAPWISGSDTATAKVGGWPNDCVAPSAIAYSDRLPDPSALSLGQIEKLKAAFVESIKLAIWAGVDAIEIHAAHGYLLSEFLSPTSNKRTDQYGGSFENRCRLVLEVAEAARRTMPAGMPLFMRYSATEWLEEDYPDEPSWTIEDSIALAKLLVGKIDLIDVSSGGNSSRQHIHAGPVRFGKDDYSAFQAVCCFLSFPSASANVLALCDQNQTSRRRQTPRRHRGRHYQWQDGAGDDGPGPGCDLCRPHVPEEPRSCVHHGGRTRRGRAHAQSDPLGLCRSRHRQKVTRWSEQQRA